MEEIVTALVSTVTVHATILRTTFVTAYATTLLDSSVTPTSATVPSVSSFVVDATLTCLSGSSSVPSESEATTNPIVALPSLVTRSVAGSVSVQLSGSSTMPPQVAATAPPSHSVIVATVDHHHKHAIIGGLSGALAGLVIIGLLICFCFRKRHRVDATEQDTTSLSEKGKRPLFIRKWTTMTTKGTPKPTPHLPADASPVTVDEDHHIIRMSVNHWHRPFAKGNGEGLRESIGPGRLRVVNPDVSRPATPRMRTALAVVLASAGRSRTNSRSTVPTVNRSPQTVYTARKAPEIAIDPALSRECVASFEAPPSFKSYLSLASLPPVHPRHADDPFITPPLDAAARQKRPALTPLHSATGLAGRTLSHLGSTLSPFRATAKPNPAESVRTVSTMSSRLSRRDTGFSDPFDLDRPSVRGSEAGYARSAQGHQGPHWSLYEGT